MKPPYALVRAAQSPLATSAVPRRPSAAGTGRSALAAGAVIFAALAVTPRPACATTPADSLADPWQDLISPDRPGAATPPTVVNRGELQLETALEGERQRPEGSPTSSVADVPLLVRVGLGHALELRFESNTLSFERAGSNDGIHHGFADLSLEAKWCPVAGSGALPAMALMPVLSLPSGSAEFSAGGTEGTLNGLLGWTLRSGATITADADVARLLDDSGSRFTQLGSAAAIEAPLRRDLAVSADVFATEPLVDGADAVWSADAALEFYPDPGTQLDLIVTRTFNASANSTGVQLGFSRRWRPRRPAATPR